MTCDSEITVVQLTTSYPVSPASPSGAFIVRLLENLPDVFHSTVLTPAASQPLQSASTGRYRIVQFRYAPWRWQLLAHHPGGIPVALKQRPLLMLWTPVFLMAMALACLRQLRDARLLHAHWSVSGVVGGVAARLLRKPSLTTLWGEDVTRAHDSWLYRQLLGWCLRLNQRVVAVSGAMQQQVKTMFPQFAHKISYIPNAVEDVLLRESRQDAQFTELRILYVGSLIARKDVATAVRALAQLAQAGCRQWTFTVVGSGEEQSALQKLAAEHGIERQIQFVGAVAPGVVADFYRKADVFVLASRSEGMPSVVLEAMAMGLPVLATDIAGVRELIEPGREGWLFPVGDAPALAAHLQHLGRDRVLRERMGQAARRTVIDKGMRWSIAAKAYADIYSELLQNAR